MKDFMRCFKSQSFSGSVVGAAPISTGSGIKVNLTAHCGIMPTKDGSNLGLVLSGFHQCCNLIPFMMAEVLIGHRATSTWRLKWPRILKHPRLPQLR